jgi:hypothetical protein
MNITILIPFYLFFWIFEQPNEKEGTLLLFVLSFLLILEALTSLIIIPRTRWLILKFYNTVDIDPKCIFTGKIILFFILNSGYACFVISIIQDVSDIVFIFTLKGVIFILPIFIKLNYIILYCLVFRK